MRSKSYLHYGADINKLRNKLHILIENEELNSETVQKQSQKLDKLILLFYGKEKKSQQK